MRPVVIFQLPHNFRDPLYPPDQTLPGDVNLDEDEDIYVIAARMQWGPCATLPIPMPQSVIVFTDRNGKPIAMTADGIRIQRKDVATVWQGVLEYNRDLAAREGEA